jgi:hypothetical protein
MSQSSIFMSYRREDSPGEAGRLYDRLAARYGSREVFRDIDHSQPGTPFPARLVNVIGSSQVVLVVIGPRWLTALNQRLQQPEDYVRLEVQAAISHDVRLIPVLVQGATMPRPEELPPDIRPLSYIDAIELDDGHWDTDSGRLLARIDQFLGGRTQVAQEQPSRRAGRTVGAGCLALVVLAVAAVALGLVVVAPKITALVSQNQSISVSPDSGTGGTSATVSGRGFFGGETVEIFFQGQPVGTATADGSGSFTASITVPSSVSVFHGTALTISAAGRTSAKSADANFTVR